MRKILSAGLLSALCAVAALAQSVASDDSVLDEARREYEAGKSGDSAAVEITLSGDIDIDVTLAAGAAPTDAAPAASAETAPAEPSLPFYPFSLTFIPGIGIFDGKAESAFAIGPVASDVYRIKGFQAAGVFCLAPGGVFGAEAAGVFNIAGDIDGLQAAGVFNIAGDVSGAEAAGVFNIAGDVSGVQVAGVFNIAGDVSGAQVAGVFNIAGKVSGVQIGLVNVCDSLDGFAIGLVNIVKDGINEVGVFYDETGYGYAFAKFGTTHTYTLLYLGEPVSALPAFDDMTAGIGWGVRFGGMNRHIDFDASGKIFVGRVNFDALIDCLSYPGTPYPYTGAYQSFLSLRAAAGIKLFNLVDVTAGFILETGIGSWSVVDPRYQGDSSFGFTAFGVPVQVYPKWFASVAL